MAGGRAAPSLPRLREEQRFPSRPSKRGILEDMIKTQPSSLCFFLAEDGGACRASLIKIIAACLAPLFFLSGCPTEPPEDPPPLEPGELEPECEEDDDCNDRDPCTTARCSEGFCLRGRTEMDPTILAVVPTSEPALHVHLQDSRWLHVATGEGGIETFDLRPLPEEPATLERHRATAASATGVSFIRDHVIAMIGSAGLEAFPRDEENSVSVYRTSGHPRSLTRVDDLIIAAMGAKGIEAIDYSDFANPRRYSRVETPGRAEQALRHGSALHVADGLGGIAFIDFRERDAPVLRPDRRRATEGRVMAISIRSPFYILAETGIGVGIIDMDDPEKDRLALLQVGGDAVGLSTLSRHTAVVAASDGGLVVLDLLNQASPRILSRVEFDEPALQISRYRERIAVALGEGGAAIVDLRCMTPE